MLDVDGAAAVEGLRAELAKAKSQARESDAAARKAREELKAEPNRLPTAEAGRRWRKLP